MTTRNSIDAFNAVMNSGYVSKKEKEVYDYLAKSDKSLTTNELFRGLYGTTTKNQPNVHARLNGLMEKGLVRKAGSRPCTITNKTVYFWDVTDKVPEKMPKKESNKIKIKRAMAFIQARGLAEEFESMSQL